MDNKIIDAICAGPATEYTPVLIHKNVISCVKPIRVFTRDKNHLQGTNVLFVDHIYPNFPDSPHMWFYNDRNTIAGKDPVLVFSDDLNHQAGVNCTMNHFPACFAEAANYFIHLKN